MLPESHECACAYVAIMHIHMHNLRNLRPELRNTDQGLESSHANNQRGKVCGCSRWEGAMGWHMTLHKEVRVWTTEGPGETLQVVGWVL